MVYATKSFRRQDQRANCDFAENAGARHVHINGPRHLREVPLGLNWQCFSRDANLETLRPSVSLLINFTG